MAPQPVQQHIAWFDRHDPAMEPHLGGKNTSLGILTMAGLPVPSGFAVTAEAYRLTLAETGLEARLAAMVSDLDVEDAAALARVADEARAMVTGTPLPQWLVDQVGAAYETLSERRGQADLP